MHRREGWFTRPLITLTAAIVATIALGTAAASAAGPQLAQATETPQDETSGWAAPAGITTAVLKQQDIEPVLGRQVRSSAGEDMGRIVNVIVDRTALRAPLQTHGSRLNHFTIGFSCDFLQSRAGLAERVLLFTGV
jgi:hypothetical protein